jgi:hypothetical protein
MHYYAALDGARQSIYELIVSFNLCQSIVGPVIFEMLVYLSIKIVRQRFVFSEPRKKSHPVMKFKRLLLHAQVLVEGADDFDK